MAWLRDIDLWFTAQVLPSAAAYRSYARRLVRDVTEAEDLVQEAYAKILAMADWQKIDAPDRFVLRTIRNLALDRFRREKIVSLRQAGQLDIEALPDPAPDAFVTTSARQELDIVMAAISTLPRGCRQVLVLRKMHGYSPKQIAEKLNLSVSTVEKHLSKALRLLTLALTVGDGRRTESRKISWLGRANRITKR